ncbi:uncharacterized protein KNAG_0B00940 [Huiozyma naganishii CBS 8797]|uniref:LYC1 C-terminal domain-containing protein n=1 Tax=Huiozyma naganishii (strain ATCC MYA-139 / BCRC 22969 / CBS 8797 / KCTC 17520 / NBRC 10181 / NCYC 3082 / Yp74L-3) TaxID=1071383 RepID=J7S4G0_HUIN7|nr:hypothetical protein KNAG_0B00940 [Kazachstania naganishii CBS 8797]CCK68541.1 hypothetical protein KNAG_0B00940 [Kazachstania naganishii CBS 8797]
MTLSDPLKFYQYTDPDVIKFTHQNNSAAWKGLLTVDEYVEREARLGESDISVKHKLSEVGDIPSNDRKWLGIRYFALEDENLPMNGKCSQIVSHCETLNRIGYCVHPESNGKIEPVLVVCVGGVFTPEMHRKKGYGSKMIKHLNKFYDDLYDREHETSPLIKNMVMTLYSEVGEYYTQFGYKSMHVPLHHVTNLDTFFQQYCQGQLNEDGTYLSFDDYGDLIKLHDKQFVQSLQTLKKVNPDKFIFTVKPDLDIFKWFQTRDRFVMTKTGKGNGEPPFGFVLQDDKSHIIWHHNWNEDTLIICKIYVSPEAAGSEDQIRHLLAHAVNECKKQRLSKLQFWDEEIPIKSYPVLNEVLNEIQHKSELSTVNGSLSGVRPPRNFTADDLIWDNNTKFCWF